MSVDLAKTPFLFIIGAAKCGTTSLFRHMAEHPRICPSNPKEPNFFSDYYERGTDWYRSIWPFDSAVHQVAMEASTCYTRRYDRPDITERIERHVQNVKFVYIVRPVYERIESEYNFALLKKYIEPGAPMVTEPYLHESMYYYQLEQFRMRFGRASILLLTMDELKRDPAAVLTRVCGHAGLSPFEATYQTASHVHNKTLPPPIYARYAHHPFVRRAKAVLPMGVRDLLRPKLYAPRQKKHSLTKRQRGFIKARLWDDSQMLKEHYGVDVGEWYD